MLSYKHIFHDLRITLFCGTFTLSVEMMLQLLFVCFGHCEILFNTSQLRYLFVRWSYAF